MGRTMLAGCEVRWHHRARQAVSRTRDSCNGDAAPGDPPSPPSTLLELVAGGARAFPDGANDWYGDGFSWGGRGRSVSKAGAAFVATRSTCGVNANCPGAKAGAAFVATRSTCGVNADCPGANWVAVELRARLSPRRSESAVSRKAQRFAVAAVDGIGDVPASSAAPAQGG